EKFRRHGDIRQFWQLRTGLAEMRAGLELARGDSTTALQILEDATAFARKKSAQAFLPRPLRLQARVLMAQEQMEFAAQRLGEARAIAEAIGSRWELWQILAATSELQQRLGNCEQADALDREARGILTPVSEHTPPDLRETFLNLPD